jgi:hypothetical protein
MVLIRDVPRVRIMGWIYAMTPRNYVIILTCPKLDDVPTDCLTVMLRQLLTCIYFTTTVPTDIERGRLVSI